MVGFCGLKCNTQVRLGKKEGPTSSRVAFEEEVQPSVVTSVLRQGPVECLVQVTLSTPWL